MVVEQNTSAAKREVDENMVHDVHDVPQPLGELSADALILMQQGHEEAMPRNFSLFSLLSLGFSITNSWIGYTGSFGVCLAAGAGPTVVYALIAATVACSIITAGLAELSSAFPSSGGQYHFAFMVSSPKLRAPTSFAVGWLSVLAWGMQCAFGPSITAQIVMFLANLHYPSFEAQRWQVYLLYVAFSIFCSSIVIFFSKKIPKIEVFVFTMSLVGFVVLTIIALARSNHKQPTEVVFLDFVNITGWNDSFAFLIGVSQAMFSYLSLDSVTHMAEEIPNPGRGVPRAMGLTMLIGAVTALPYTIAVLYSSSNLAEVQVSSVPIVTIYIQIMRSTAGATFLAVWFILIFLGAEVSCIVTTSRLVWAFARDNGLPFSKTFAKVHPKFEAPINAVILTCAFFSIYGAIYIGSLSAFNSFVSLSILGLNVTYVVPQIIAFWRGRDKVLPKRYLDLGPWFGPFCNVISTAWVCVVLVVFCFPVFIPVDAASMNYVSVVTVGVVVVILAMWWGGKRKTFTGPKAILEGVPGPLAERVMNLDDSVPKTMH